MNRPKLIFLLIIFFYSNNTYTQSKAKSTDCFANLTRKEKQLNRYLSAAEKNFTDDYAYILSIYNCNYIDSSQRSHRFLQKLSHQATYEIKRAQNDTNILCPQIDRMHLLLGKTYYGMQDYEKAIQVFETMIQQFPQSISLAEAYLYLAKINMCMNEFEEAENYLQLSKTFLQNLDSVCDLSKHWLATAADNYLRQDVYILAIPLVQQILIKQKISRSIQTRLLFILGQMHQYMGNDSEAVVYFNQVIQRRSSDIMHAYAYVNSDLCCKRQQQKISDSIRIEAIENNYCEDFNFEPTIVESIHDSDFIHSIYPYYFNDPATMFFLDESEWTSDTLDDEWYDDYDTTMISDELLAIMLENWDSVSVHIPKTDFKNFTDTIFLPLFDPIEGYMLPYFGELTSRFGWRRYRYHYGIDTKNQYGEPIYCVFDGVVRIAKRSRTYGNVLVIRHSNGLETFYAHCSRLLVKQNQEVKAGDIIALIGSTGRSTGPHLHFETRYKGNPFDPEILIDFENKKLRSDTLIITKETFNYRNPYGQGASKSSRSGNAVYHKVKSGETLSGIARKYRTSVSSIKRLNGLRSDMIREGRNLRVK